MDNSTLPGFLCSLFQIISNKDLLIHNVLLFSFGRLLLLTVWNNSIQHFFGDLRVWSKMINGVLKSGLGVTHKAYARVGLLSQYCIVGNLLARAISVRSKE